LVYDLVIIGGGPAGLSAALYGARAKLKVLLLEKEIIGGQAAITDWIENYPGYPEGISGLELTEKMKEQALKFGAEIVTCSAKAVKPSGKLKKISTSKNEDYLASAVIIATGRRSSKLNVPGEAEFTGKGVSYCATCDAPLFKDKKIFVVGGGNAAIQEAIFLTKFARKVTVIHRRDQLRAGRILQERAFANKKIDFLWNSVVTKIEGNQVINKISVKNVKTGQLTQLEADGIFVFIGNLPNTEFLDNLVKLDENGYILTDEKLSTSMPGIFAAGDVRHGSLKQIVAAAAEGALAAVSAEEYIERKDR
jgi:thioredoxin reductase (NADPH)